MKIILFQGLYSPQLCQEHPDWLFLFGDNITGKGTKGQAIIRDEPNSFGVPTKVLPSESHGAYFNDSEPYGNWEFNGSAIQWLNFKFNQLKGFRVKAIVIPIDPQYITEINPHGISIGCGLAQMPTRCPETFKYLMERFEELIKAANEVEEAKT